jgi:TPR repeat protein
MKRRQVSVRALTLAAALCAALPPGLVTLLPVPAAAQSAGDWEAAPQAQLEAAAEAGTAGAQYALALRLEEGRGLVQNYRLAVEWFARAAEQGHVAAQGRLGQYYHHGLGVEKDRDTAIHWLERAAASGQAQALFDLAAVVEQGPEGRGDPARAGDLYRRAMEQGHDEAAVSLGVLYQNGRGVAQDLARARSLYEGPAAAGNARAQNNLGLMYVRGEGVPQDYARAADLFQSAAEQGLAVAIGNLATMYENGFGVPLDEVRAAELNRQAGRSGDQVAGEAAGPDLRPGSVFDTRLLPPDTGAESLQQLQSGARAGDPLAEFLLGWLLLQEGREDYARHRQAATLLRRAAEAGYPAAQANLGLMYFEGRALPQDYVLGYMWLVLAGSAGLAEARALSAALLPQMTPEQIIEAQELAEARVNTTP